MTFIARLVYLVAQSLYFVAGQLSRLASAFDGLLPALFSPAQLNTQTRKVYKKQYNSDLIQRSIGFEWQVLLAWENDVLNRHAMKPGLMLIMGCGFGREALAIARRGIAIVGVDSSAAAVQTAQRLAKASGVPARFHVADYLTLPYVSPVFDYAILSATMYSAIPGMAQRQAWLNDLCRILKPEGLLILSFAGELWGNQRSRLGTLLVRLTTILARLPGGNHSYQIGDTYGGGHFMHFFQNEEEIKKELDGAGALIRELDWARGFAVVDFKRRARHSTLHAREGTGVS
jgi:SAM-dependent methyltransferase